MRMDRVHSLSSKPSHFGLESNSNIESDPPHCLSSNEENSTMWYKLFISKSYLNIIIFTTASDCLASDLLIESKRTVNNLKELSVEGEAAAMTYSAFHCQQKCQNDIDCELFSWLKPSEENSTEGECRLMESLGSTNDSESISPMTFQSGWVSSAKTCDIFLQHFSSKELLSYYICALTYWPSERNERGHLFQSNLFQLWPLRRVTI